MIRPAHLAAAVALVTSAALFGCGGTNAPATVARVQGSGISRDALLHWTGIKRSELQSVAGATSASGSRAQTKALAFLITALWLEKEAATYRLTASPGEVETTYNRLLSGPTGAAFAASMKRRGLSRADELLVLRLGALAQKLRAKIALDSPSISEALVRKRVKAFIASYRQRWKQRTQCDPAYAIAECRNGPPIAAQASAP